MSAVTERRKRGEPHPSGDGRVFEGYHTRAGVQREQWISPEQLEKERRRARERTARRRAENPEKTRELNLAWARRNSEKCKERSAGWKAANKERVREYKARWRAANKEKMKESDARWRKENADARRAFNAQRRAMKQSATHPEHSTEIEIALLQSAARLRKCLGIDFHLDHAIPLARGGTHHHTNLRVLPGRFNVRKRDRLDCELPSNLQTAIKQWSPYLN